MDTCKEHYLPPEHARSDTDKEYFPYAVNACTNYPTADDPTHTSKATDEGLEALADLKQERPPNALSSTLASIAWQDKAGIGHRRLYHQSSTGQILESAWDSKSQRWQVFNEGLTNARPDSPITAAVIGPQKSLSVDGRILELYTDDGKTWTNGSLSSELVTPSNDCDFAAVFMAYDGCDDCSGALLLAYQATTDVLWVAIRTSSNVVWTTLETDPHPGSGLTFSQLWQDNAPPGARLYYQRNQADLVSVDWEPRANLSGCELHLTTSRVLLTRLAMMANLEGWNVHKNAMVGRVLTGAPMATGFNEENREPLMVDILSTGAQCVAVN
ncbi:MAG: hypothetical protein Q9210_001017 [Variospora velana]